MMAATRCFRGDRAALMALRLRRMVSFLRRHRLHDTAHDLERQTGAFFDAAHFRRLLRHYRWADASSYALGFVTPGHCSGEADTLVVRILILRVMDDLAAGRSHGVDARFQRLYASLDSHSGGHILRRVLLAMRSDRARASNLYRRSKNMAVDVILNLAAKCPELKAKSQLPRCTFDPAYALTLGPGLRGCKMHQKNKPGCIPAHIIARSFTRQRPHLLNHGMNYSGKKHSRPDDAHFPESFEQASDSREGTRLRTTGEFAESPTKPNQAACRRVADSIATNPREQERRVVAGNRQRGMGLQSPPLLLLQLRQLDRFLKRQGLHSAAHTLERESLVYFDASHMQKLVRDGRWEAAGTYMCRFSQLWEGEGTYKQFTAFQHTLENHAMLHFLACRGDEGGRAASDLFCCDDDAFRNNFPEIAQRHDLYRSMASKQARASVNWEAIKLATLEKLQELLHLRPDLECSLQMREPQCTSMPSEIIPLGLRGSKRHRRKRVDNKPARELSLFFQRKRLSSSPEAGHSGDSGVSSATLLQSKEDQRAFDIFSSAANTCGKRSRSQYVDCDGISQQPFDPTECFKRPRMAGDVSVPGEISA